MDNAIKITGRPANSEMLEGFLDGYDLSLPEPSANRSHSYRHGFANGMPGWARRCSSTRGCGRASAS